LLGALSLLFCTVNRELFDLCVLFPCNCILLQQVVFLLSNTIDKKSKMLFPFLYCYSTVQYILFHLSLLMTVYPYEHTKELKLFINMYTTSLAVKNYFETLPDLSPKTALIIEIPRVPEYLTRFRKSSHHWVILNDRYSTVWIAVHNLKSSKCSPDISV